MQWCFPISSCLQQLKQVHGTLKKKCKFQINILNACLHVLSFFERVILYTSIFNLFIYLPFTYFLFNNIALFTWTVQFYLYESCKCSLSICPWWLLYIDINYVLLVYVHYVTRKTLIIHCLLTRQSNVPVCNRSDWTGLEKGFSTYFQLSGGYRSGDNLLLHYICLCCSPGYLSRQQIFRKTSKLYYYF